jgi:glucosamine--fructose-6-phosphate aminotransferase (isomerizing)
MSAARFGADIQAQPRTLEHLCSSYGKGEAFEALRAAAQALTSSAAPPVLTGMGASYFALVAARPTFEREGARVLVEETAYLVEYGLHTLLPGQPVLAVSQSGHSAESVDLAERMPRSNPLIVMTNNPTTPLARRADIVLPLLADPDLSVALKTYTATVALLLMLAEQTVAGTADDVRRRILAADMAKAITTAENSLDAMVSFVGSPRCVIALGRGPSTASALGTGLLLKEGAKIPAEGMGAAQFRHGAVEVVDEETLVVLFAPEGSASEANRRLAAELYGYGARVLTIGPDDFLPHGDRAMTVSIQAPDEFLAPLFEIVPAQLLTSAIAVARGVEPGAFVNTTPVITSL